MMTNVSLNDWFRYLYKKVETEDPNETGGAPGDAGGEEYDEPYFTIVDPKEYRSLVDDEKKMIVDYWENESSDGDPLKMMSCKHADVLMKQVVIDGEENWMLVKVTQPKKLKSNEALEAEIQVLRIKEKKLRYCMPLKPFLTVLLTYLLLAVVISSLFFGIKTKFCWDVAKSCDQTCNKPINMDWF